MAIPTNLKDLLTQIADSIRGKTGTTSAIQAYAMPSHINSIKTLAEGTANDTATSADILEGKTAHARNALITGSMLNQKGFMATVYADNKAMIAAGYHDGTTYVQGASLSSQTQADATANHILANKTAWVNGEKITGTIPTKTSTNLTTSGAKVIVPAGYYASEASKSIDTVTQATPRITVNHATGLITASALQNAGYVNKGSKSGEKQLTTQAAKTVTPTTSEQTAVASGCYTTGAVKVAAIPSKYQDVSGVTATTGDVAEGKVIVDANGNALTGTIQTYTSADNVISMAPSELYYDGGYIYTNKPLTTDTLFRAGSGIEYEILGSKFGNATINDVAVGKTFTSTTGLLQTGTAFQINVGSGNIPANANGGYYTSTSFAPLQFTPDLIYFIAVSTSESPSTYRCNGIYHDFYTGNGEAWCRATYGFANSNSLSYIKINTDNSITVNLSTTGFYLYGWYYMVAIKTTRGAS